VHLRAAPSPPPRAREDAVARATPLIAGALALALAAACVS
jgi:hypothetical protein